MAVSAAASRPDVCAVQTTRRLTWLRRFLVKDSDPFKKRNRKQKQQRSTRGVLTEGKDVPTSDVQQCKKEERTDSVALDVFPAEIRKYMQAEGIVDGTTVQLACWKEMTNGRNCRVMSQPGTGKTLAFLLPIVVRLRSMPPSSGPRALIFVPTRELADQIFTVCSKLRKLFQLKTVSACGGAPIACQVTEIQNGADIIVGTPGRLVELLFDKHIELSDLKIVVLDEADKMLAGDLGRQLTGLKDFILSNKMNKPQVCVFSATLPEELDAVFREWIGNDVASLMFSTDARLVSSNITQVVHVCAEHKKLNKLKKHLANIKGQSPDKRHLPRILIFANTIKKVRSIYTELQQEGFRLAMLHGKRTQAERHEAMDGFRSGKVQVLVATDVAGRGLDVKDLPFVVNYDFPTRLETYIHRIGRTGRLAADGHAFSFFTRNLAPMTDDLISLLDHHHQCIDPNLRTLSSSYKEASAFMKEIQQIENEADAEDGDPSSAEHNSAEQCATIEHLGDALIDKKRPRKETSSTPSPVFAKKKHCP